MEKQVIYENIAELVTGEGFLLVDMVIRGDSKKQVVEIFVDNEVGVSSEDCARLSRVIDEFVYENEVFSKNYRLDVSSPGVSRPLKYLLQYNKHIGRKLELEYLNGDDVKKFEGTLKDVKEELLLFAGKNEELSIEFKNIKSAKVIISF